jgi:hypothetical protein
VRDVIPESVFRAIQEYLRERTAFAEQGWTAGEDDEDTLTGDFGASLRTPGSGRDVLGHTSTRITEEHYEHPVPAEALRGMKRLEEKAIGK